MSDGCSGGMDALARWINKYIRRAGGGRNLAFTGCCAEHDQLYEEGTRWQGWGRFFPWLLGRIKDIPWRWKADKLLRECIAANLKKRNRSPWVQLHVPWCFWIGARVLGWWHWGTE